MANWLLDKLRSFPQAPNPYIEGREEIGWADPDYADARESYNEFMDETGMSPDANYGMLNTAYENEMSPEMSPEVSPREFARVFDPTSNADVLKLQGMLGVQQDGILGPETERALRELQGVSYEAPEGMGAETTPSPSFAGEPDAEAWIRGMDPDYMKEPDSVSDYYGESPEFQGPTQEEVDTQAWLNRNMMQDEMPYAEEGLDEYDEYGNLMGSEMEPGVTNLSRFNMLARQMNPNLDKYYDVDMGSSAPSTLSGVQSFDPRFMQTPQEGQTALRRLVNQALNISKRK